MKHQSHLVIGASGGIGQAVVQDIATRYPNDTVYAISRGEIDTTFNSNVVAIAMQTDDETAIKHWLAQCKAEGTAFHTVVCCTGMLHGEIDQQRIRPEKRLEDIHRDQMLAYFDANTVVPSLWLKHLVNHMVSTNAYIAMLSARVGSISDNRLGGWYGYRASKAALNMMIKTSQVEYGRRSPNTILVSYHPGTVDTGLSKPFQANVKPEKLFTPAFTAQQLITHLAGLNREQAPYFIDWEGKLVNW